MLDCYTTFAKSIQYHLGMDCTQLPYLSTKHNTSVFSPLPAKPPTLACPFCGAYKLCSTKGQTVADWLADMYTYYA